MHFLNAGGRRVFNQLSVEDIVTVQDIEWVPVSPGDVADRLMAGFVIRETASGNLWRIRNTRVETVIDGDWHPRRLTVDFDVPDGYESTSSV